MKLVRRPRFDGMLEGSEEEYLKLLETSREVLVVSEENPKAVLHYLMIFGRWVLFAVPKEGGSAVESKSDQ
jgi:hypothetical protein